MNPSAHRDRPPLPPQLLTLQVQPPFTTADANKIKASFTNVGRIGFAVTETDPPSGGIGFRFDNRPNLLFDGRIICGTGPDRLSNSIRTELADHRLTRDRDFVTTPTGDVRKLNQSDVETNKALPRTQTATPTRRWICKSPKKLLRSSKHLMTNLCCCASPSRTPE